MTSRRDTLRDAYEEAERVAASLRQALAERDAKVPPRELLLEAADAVYDVWQRQTAPPRVNVPEDTTKFCLAVAREVLSNPLIAALLEASA